MNRRAIFIIIGAVIFALLVGLLWFWFFRSTTVAPPNTGGFGTGTDRPGASTPAGSQTNIPSGVQTGSQTNTNLGTVVTGNGSVSVPSGGTSAGGNGGGYASVPGVDWVGGSTAGGSGGPTTNFVPTTINQLNNGSVGGTPGLLGSGGTAGQAGDDNSLIYGAAGAAVAGAGCALLAGFQASGVGQAGAEAASGLIPVVGSYVLVYDFYSNSKQAGGKFKDMGDCLARTIGKVVIQQLTNSIVNWINSGFNGQPAFVTNYQQFFSNVGDAAAGEFIRGTSLSFLCTPFQNQIRIAIAQSYARRNSGGSCSLTSVVGNINAFMNGNFSQGGWQGLLSFTGNPTNNPFGAYSYAQSGLASAQLLAVNNARSNVTPGGFISLQRKSCIEVPSNTAPPTPPGGSVKQNGTQNGVTNYTVCQNVTTTPGSIIEETLNKTLEQPFLANQLAKSFDEILGALLNQLVTRTLYEGLSTLSGTQGYAASYLTPEQQQAQERAQTLLTDMQGKLSVSQQYGAVWQGAISDIQNAQRAIQEVVNCWEIASSTIESSPKSETARVNAENTRTLLHSFDPQIATYNNNITKANQSIAKLEELQTALISASSASDINQAKAAYDQALATGVIISPAEVTSAQQDRASLQASLAIRNQQTAAALQTCNAF